MELTANAKINLTLDIVGKKEDGYHLINSVFQSISLFDQISVEKSSDITVSFSDNNISALNSVAYRSALAFFDYTGIKCGADIKITNHIPTSSGMGGGSSDAAAVLTGLNQLFGAGLTTGELIKISARLGADIPFCLVGGTAKVSGIGENVSPVKFAGAYPIIIIKDNKKSSTAEMYSKLDKIKPSVAKTEDLIKAVNSNNKDLFFGCISNAFNAVCDTAAEKSLLKKYGALATGLTGSGPSVFGIFEDKSKRDKAYDELKSKHNCFKADFSSFGIKTV